MKPINKRQLNVFIWRLSKHMVFQNQCSIEVTPLREHEFLFHWNDYDFAFLQNFGYRRDLFWFVCPAIFIGGSRDSRFSRKFILARSFFPSQNGASPGRIGNIIFFWRKEWKGNWRKKKVLYLFKQLLNVTEKCLTFVYKSIACLYILCMISYVSKYYIYGFKSKDFFYRN